ncbi:hypothetical protein COO91_03276 [Nostoc flagelliforme CCNUN1]|uniref:Uncharacterized protein n=1 Tax=Nostoc flagelliforme CCNUN1 TaxID=2038116 RepID=A0A2K8SPD3_9NOSO|nr:hypothetical protein COO91_03276 [Nostoc flagelliforme CCNUN1]
MSKFHTAKSNKILGRKSPAAILFVAAELQVYSTASVS